MKWSSVSEKYPDQFVKLKNLLSTVSDGHEIIEDVALISVVEDQDATSELLKQILDAYKTNFQPSVFMEKPEIYSFIW